MLMAALRLGPSCSLYYVSTEKEKKTLDSLSTASGDTLTDLLLQVTEYDCLLLEFVFGQRPDDSQKVSRRRDCRMFRPTTSSCFTVCAPLVKPKP